MSNLPQFSLCRRLLVMACLIVSGGSGVARTPHLPSAKTQPLRHRLMTQKIKKIEVEDVPAGDVLRFLAEQAKAGDPEDRALNMFIRAEKQDLAVPLTFDLADIPINEVLRYIEMTTNLQFHYERHAVIVTSKTAVRR